MGTSSSAAEAPLRLSRFCKGRFLPTRLLDGKEKFARTEKFIQKAQSTNVIRVSQTICLAPSLGQNIRKVKSRNE
jgi:hypothetical protein